MELILLEVEGVAVISLNLEEECARGKGRSCYRGGEDNAGDVVVGESLSH